MIPPLRGHTPTEASTGGRLRCSVISSTAEGQFNDSGLCPTIYSSRVYPLHRGASLGRPTRQYLHPAVGTPTYLGRYGGTCSYELPGLAIDVLVCIVSLLQTAYLS